MFFHSSRYILRLLGSITLLLTTSTTVFFTLYSISTLSAVSVIAPLCTTAAVFNIATCISLLIFTIFPSRKRLHILGGIIPTAIAVTLSTLVLGWMSFRPRDMPEVMFGLGRDPLVIAGFSLFVVSLVSQTIFWTLQAFARPHPSDQAEGIESTLAEVTGKSAPPYDFTPTSYSGITVEDEKYSAFVNHVIHHTPNLHNSTVLHVTEKSPITELVVEIDPFDSWDTSDVGATQRAACALAASECEKDTRVAVGLGIFTPVSNTIAVNEIVEGEARPRETEEEAQDVQIHVPTLERQNSPPIPDYDMTPRSTSFPVGIFREHTSMASVVGRRPILVVSPIGESREFDEGSGRLVPTRSPRGDMGTGKWLVRSQTMA